MLSLLAAENLLASGPIPPKVTGADPSCLIALSEIRQFQI
jgi:hypothetical protein